MNIKDKLNILAELVEANKKVHKIKDLKWSVIVLTKRWVYFTSIQEPRWLIHIECPKFGVLERPNGSGLWGINLKHHTKTLRCSGCNGRANEKTRNKALMLIKMEKV